MNAHDLKRIMILKKTLELAKERADTAAVYLSVTAEQREQLWDLHLVAEHIGIALERLADLGKVTACQEMLPATSTS